MAFGFLATMAIVIGMSAFWLFLSTSPVKIKYADDKFLSYPVADQKDIHKAEITKVRAGQVVYQHVEYCVIDSKPGRVIEIYQDGITLTLPPRATISEVGCFKRNFPRIIPPTLPPGEYTYTLVIRTKVNPLSFKEVKFKPITFEIVK